MPHDRVRQTTVSDGPLSGVVVGQSAFIADMGSQRAGVDEMANAAGPRRVNDVVVLPHPFARVRAGRGDEQQPVGAVE